MKLISRMNNDENLFDNFFGSFGYPWLQTNKNQHIMKTDIVEEKDHYIMTIDVPGFAKNEIKVLLDEGYLVVSAAKEAKDDNKKDNYVHHERMYESCTRSYYVGDITDADITAKHENGTLQLRFPKEKTPQEKSRIIKVD